MAKQNKTNFLSPNKFRITIHKYPKVELYAQSLNVPGFTVGTPERFTNTGRDYNLTGDKIFYNDFTVSFIVDEAMESYFELLDWCKRIVNEPMLPPGKGFSREVSDMTLHILTNNSNVNISCTFKDCFPYTVSDLPLNTMIDENSPVVADVTFKFSSYSYDRK